MESVFQTREFKGSMALSCNLQVFPAWNLYLWVEYQGFFTDVFSIFSSSSSTILEEALIMFQKIVRDLELSGIKLPELNSIK